jgi:hypothetical protein
MIIDSYVQQAEGNFYHSIRTGMVLRLPESLYLDDRFVAGTNGSHHKNVPLGVNWEVNWAPVFLPSTIPVLSSNIPGWYIQFYPLLFSINPVLIKWYSTVVQYSSSTIPVIPSPVHIKHPEETMSLLGDVDTHIWDQNGGA